MLEELEPLDYPRLSLAERELRWTRVRGEMRRQGLDCLVLPYNTGHWGMFQAEMQYLTQLGDFEGEIAAVFPLEGEVTAWCQHPMYIPMWKASQGWVQDIRNSAMFWSKAIIERLRELGLGSAHIGIMGVEGLIHAPEGTVDHRLVEALKDAFPQARFSNATPWMQRLRAVKSDEEVEALRTAVGIAESAIADAAKVAKVGTPDAHVYGEVLAAMLRHGGAVPTLMFWRAGPEVGMQYLYPTRRPLQWGDIISSEIEGKYLGYRGQVHQPIAVGHLKEPYEGLLQVAVELFNHLMPLMRPGTTYGQLLKAAAEFSAAAPHDARLMMQGRGMGEDWPLVLGQASPDVLETPLEVNNTLVLKPFGWTRTEPIRRISWGEVVVVKPGGAQRLGTRPQSIIIAGQAV